MIFKRLYQFRRTAHGPARLKEPIFIVGHPRSGTTFLARLLGSHPNVAYWEEAGMGAAMRTVKSSLDDFVLRRNLQSEMNVAEIRSGARLDLQREPTPADREQASQEALWYVQQFFHSLCADFVAQKGASRYLGKTPSNVLHLDILNQVFPDCRVVHIIRDVRAVVASYYWRDLFGKHGFAVTRDQGEKWLAESWVRHIQAGRAARAVLGTRYREIIYRSLGVDFEAAVGQILRFVGIPWHRRMRRFLEAGLGPFREESVERWKSVLTRDQIDVIETIAGPLLEELGFALVSRPTENTASLEAMDGARSV